MHMSSTLNIKLSFKDKVLSVVKNIPIGKTMTYKEVAKRAKSPQAFRAVGSILAKNFDKKNTLS